MAAEFKSRICFEIGSLNKKLGCVFISVANICIFYIKYIIVLYELYIFLNILYNLDLNFVIFFILNV